MFIINLSTLNWPWLLAWQWREITDTMHIYLKSFRLAVNKSLPVTLPAIYQYVSNTPFNLFESNKKWKHAAGMYKNATSTNKLSCERNNYKFPNQIDNSNLNYWSNWNTLLQITLIMLHWLFKNFKFHFSISSNSKSFQTPSSQATRLLSNFLQCHLLFSLCPSFPLQSLDPHP